MQDPDLDNLACYILLNSGRGGKTGPARQACPFCPDFFAGRARLALFYFGRGR